MKTMTIYGAVMCILGGLLLLRGGAPEVVHAQEKPAVVVHLTHYTDDLHAAFMALKLANAMQAKNTQVTLVLDLEGVRLVSSQQPQNLHWGTSGEIAGYYDAFIKAGGKIVVCPHCAKAAGLEDTALRSGAQIVTEEALATTLLAADKILDY